MSTGLPAHLVSATARGRWAPAWTISRLPAWTITAALGLLYLAIAPRSADLAAATYRSELFGRAGFTVWDNGWYAGHHLPAYSMLAPALGWLIGPPLLAAVSMTTAAALFAALIDARFPARATRIAAIWFAFGAGVGLLSSRVPFDLGLAVGLGALLLAQRDRRAPALALAMLCAVASPVAGAFLALAALAWALAGRSPGGAPRRLGAPYLSPVPRRRERGLRGVGRARLFPALLALAAVAPIAALELAFPEGGTQPFVASAFYPGLVGVLAIAVMIGSEQRALRIGVLLYAAAFTAAYVIPTAVGANVDRLAALVAGPVAACVLAGRTALRRGLLLLLAPFLLYWQVNAPVADFSAAISNPSVRASYYAPLLAELRALGVGYSERPARIEVVPTSAHWETVWVAGRVSIARGWERQLDRYRNGLFYEESTRLTPARYRAWLSGEAISYVALPDAPLDYSAAAEGRLLERVRASGRGGGAAAQARPFLREVWRSAHWRLFAVLGARPLAQAPAVLTQLGGDSFTLAVPRPGRYLVRVRFTRYWALSRGRGCVREAPGAWTELEATRAGSLHVVVDFSLERVLAHGPRCR
jgi:hypothetical protein